METQEILDTAQSPTREMDSQSSREQNKGHRKASQLEDERWIDARATEEGQVDSGDR